MCKCLRAYVSMCICLQTLMCVGKFNNKINNNDNNIRNKNISGKKHGK